MGAWTRRGSVGGLRADYPGMGLVSARWVFTSSRDLNAWLAGWAPADELASSSPEIGVSKPMIRRIAAVFPTPFGPARVLIFCSVDYVFPAAGPGNARRRRGRARPARRWPHRRGHIPAGRPGRRSPPGSRSCGSSTSAQQAREQARDRHWYTCAKGTHLCARRGVNPACEGRRASTCWRTYSLWRRSRPRPRAGVVLHTGPHVFGLGNRITAAPIGSLWVAWGVPAPAGCPADVARARAS